MRVTREPASRERFACSWLTRETRKVKLPRRKYNNTMTHARDAAHTKGGEGGVGYLFKNSLKGFIGKSIFILKTLHA